MKRCPECYEVYEDQVRFCEADGNELLADPTFSRDSYAAPPAPPVVRSVWWPAAALGVVIGLGFGAGIFALISLSSSSVANEPQTVRQPSEVREKTPANRLASTAPSAPTPEPEESPSPSPEVAAAEPSPTANTDNNASAAQLNRGPISTGQKPTKANETEASVQTVIEMSDGSTLDVDAAWEDKQGVWYRRSGLVSFVESSRVKAITARRAAAKATTELQDR
jgi:hypothetical protein